MLSIIFIGCIGMVFSQQIPQYSQYMFNRMLINPGATGSDEDLPIQIAVRQQWAGFEDAPSTQILSGHYRFSQYNMGVGATLFLDRFGHERKLGLQLNYAYMIDVFYDTKLAFGLSLQLFQYQLDYTNLVALDQTDEVIYNSTQSKFVPETDFGIYLYNDYYFAGLSANQMIGMPVKIAGEEIQMSKLVQHYNLMGGYRFDLQNDFEIEPSLLLKSSFKAPTELDINVRGIYQENYWLGFSYRTAGDIITMLGLKYDPIDFGLAIDFATSEIARYQNGSYELFVKYTLPINQGPKGRSLF